MRDFISWYRHARSFGKPILESIRFARTKRRYA